MCIMGISDFICPYVVYNMGMYATPPEIRKSKRYDKLLLTHQDLMVKSAQNEETLNEVLAANVCLQKRVAQLENIVRKLTTG